ncbi:Pumilio domain-containing protein P35G2.14 [Choanephora cucurbitarum]|uniref:Pumilio domain-containing protein P35G2.14 n=1 Tax=Choanephora cucurbitarum TaxID=101091 RepID=A0A1C7NHA2_9FUNG|nr:Pumilio domain-containing protein P35G2.14 [Choanephora cucurbitarum]
MDFAWVSDAHKHLKNKESDQHSSDNVRRARAGTMPSSTLSPFLNLNPYIAQQKPQRSGSFSDLTDSSLDDNSTIASTLASLGLHDDPELPTMRHRAFTVSSKTYPDMTPFSPFLLDQPMMNNNPPLATHRRPRAISLGMADQKPFSPFDHFRATSNLTDDLLYNPFSHVEEAKEEENEDEGGEGHQTPSRALWLGNINSSVSVPDLHQIFSCYGRVESARILSDKECAFVNFETVESALAAKEDLVNRLGSKVKGSAVKVGFGKADVSVAMALSNEAGPNAQGPTRSLWVGNIPADINPAVLRSLFQRFGSIESIRILSHKNCGFVNFEKQEDAVRARKKLQNKEILGRGTGIVRVGFAKAPDTNDIVEDVVINGNKWSTVIWMATMMMNAQKQQLNSSSVEMDENKRLMLERLSIMEQLGYQPNGAELERAPVSYATHIPAVPEFSVDRKLSPLRLREIRKAFDNVNAVLDIEAVAVECNEEIVELCSDYIGNIIVQKLFEQCCQETKHSMLVSIAPHLASIGVHKNGTWAAQKIIDMVQTNEQAELVTQHIAPYVPLLLLDQFGNYVVQCCLRMDRNQFIFDAIVDNCWEIGQGRFGARAIRAILENSLVTKEQQIYVAAAIMQKALVLSTNANGSILLNWLLDTSGLLGQYRT